MEYTIKEFSGESYDHSHAIALAAEPALKWLKENQRQWADGNTVYTVNMHMFHTISDKFICIITVIGPNPIGVNT